MFPPSPRRKMWIFLNQIGQLFRTNWEKTSRASCGTFFGGLFGLSNLVVSPPLERHYLLIYLGGADFFFIGSLTDEFFSISKNVQRQKFVWSHGGFFFFLSPTGTAGWLIAQYFLSRSRRFLAHRSRSTSFRLLGAALWEPIVLSSATELEGIASSVL